MNRPTPSRVYRAAVAILRPLVSMITRPRRWRGAEHLPDGPFVVVANHLSVFDPMTLLHFLVEHDVYPCIVAKESLWRVPVLGWVLRRVDAVPVHRGTSTAGGALDAAETALRRGYAVLLYPEGTTTTDPDDWPMPAKTGAARLALRTGAAVIPIAQWGAQRVIPNRGKGFHPFPPQPSDVLVGPPVELADLLDRHDDPAAWREATERIMGRITAQLAEIRGEQPPSRPRP